MAGPRVPAPRGTRGWRLIALVAIAAVIYVGYALYRSATVVRAEGAVASTTQTLGEVADPLLRLCEQDPTIRERVGRACDTASQAVSVVAERGADGRNGVDGVAGTPGLDGAAGTNGVDGVDGQSPPCLSEPAQCRGADGRNGVDGVDGAPGRDGRDGVNGTNGTNGAPGPTCPDGTTLQPVMFASGQEGLGCVSS